MANNKQEQEKKDIIGKDVKPQNSTNSKGKGKGKRGKKSSGNYNNNRNSSRNATRNYTDNESRSYDDDPKRGQGSRPSYDSVQGNDISWWNKTPLYGDVTRVPFNRIYGSSFNTRWSNERSEKYGFTNEPMINNLAGIMAIEFVPSIGTSVNANSAVNRTFNSLFGELYSKTTGTPPIQQMDVAFLITSLASIACGIGYCKRALGVAQLYNNWNYNFPRGLIQAMGFEDPDQIIRAREQIRVRLNDIILNFNNFKIPDILDIYVRQYALAHNVYADEDDVTSAMYVFNPRGVYKYTKEADSHLPILAFRNYDLTKHQEDTFKTIWSVMDTIDDCLESWRNTSDLNLIKGTLQRAFSDSQTISLDYVREDDVVIPVVDRNIMWQVNNMNLFTPDDVTLHIRQDPVNNYMIFNPETQDHIVDNLTFSRVDHILNSYDGKTDDEFIMEATRLISFVDPETNSIVVPTEFVSDIKIFYSSNGTDPHLDQVWVQTTHLIDAKSSAGSVGNNKKLEDAMKMVGLLSQFRIHPFVYIYFKLNLSAIHDHPVLIGDLYRFTTIDNIALKGLHKAATQSAYRLYLK